MDESVAKDFDVYTKKGTQFMAVLIPVNSKDMNDFASESKDDTLKRFKKMMEALIGEVAELKGLDRTEYRDMVKEALKLQGRIKESTGELDIDGLAYVITHLKKTKHELEHRQR